MGVRRQKGTPRIAGNQPLSKEAVLAVMEGTRGIIADIARRLGVSRNAVYAALERYPELKEAIRQEKESFKDDVEITLAQEMLGGWVANPESPDEKIYRFPNSTLLIFWAKTQMRDRGYIEKVDLGLDPELTKQLTQLQAVAKQKGISLQTLFSDLASEINSLEADNE